MFRLKGTYTTATIFQDKNKVEEECIKQIQTLIDSPAYEDCQVKIMPDCHAGASCPIGTTIALKNRVIPETVSVDIGCGVLVVNLGKKTIDFEKLDNIIKAHVPSGLSVNDKSYCTINLKELHCYDSLKNIERLECSIGSLGGGNHFISVEVDEEGNNYLIIHTGSRNLGVQVCEYYQELANKILNDKSADYEKEMKETINYYKEAGDTYLIPDALKALKEKYKNLANTIPHDLAYLEGENFDNYIHDMKICQEFAKQNRETIAKNIINNYFNNVLWGNFETFETVHNYIDMKKMILRKGSVSAKKGEKLIIPINMKDGSLICEGKSNKSYNYSAPHGAGRLMSRTKARETLTMDEFKRSMEGIYTTCVCEGTLDESAMAYKPLEDILPNIVSTVKVICRVKPVYNFKATD